MHGESSALLTTPPDRRDQVRQLVRQACEPIAFFWPMKRFVKRNPINGFEHLPFDRAVCEAKRLLGGNGYLSNQEYRQSYRVGRITAAGVGAAMKRMGPSALGAASVLVRARSIKPADVWRTHLLFGLDAIEPPQLLHWTLGAGGALSRFQDDLPEEARRRILNRFASDRGQGPEVAEPTYLRELWDSVVQAATRTPELVSGERQTNGPPAVDLPAAHTMADWLDVLAEGAVVQSINAQLIKWVAAFVDEGMAGWAMPGRQGGLYQAWRGLAPRDWSGRLLGIPDFAARVRGLPAAPEAAIVLMLQRLGVPEGRWAEYLSRHLAQLPGWAGLIRWLGENPPYPGQVGHPADATQYLAIRLFYEVELCEALCRRTWHTPGTVPALVEYWRDRADEHWRLVSTGGSALAGDANAMCERAWPLFRLAQWLELMPDEIRELAPSDVDALLRWLALFPADRHAPVWLEAYEESYRLGLLGLLAGHREASNRATPAAAAARPRAQIVFCIDVRSESFRRHVEARGAYETFGYAGFFGVAMNHEAFDSEERLPLCPVLLTPKHAVDETVRNGERGHLESYASGTRWLRLASQLFHDLKQHPLSSLMLVDVLGFSFAAGLAGKTLAPALHQSVAETVRGWFRQAVATQVSVDGGTVNVNGSRSLGFTIAEQAGIVEAGLRTIGLTSNYGRFIVLCGHGSISDNNPYFGALHCGACGGMPGDANARAFATMANHPEVRALIGQHGLAIPADTWFLAGKHTTTSDRVELYDVDDVPASHQEDLRALRSDLESAGAAQALERCRRLPRAAGGGSPEHAYSHVEGRTVDWANVRPEWGLSSNAAFIIARRNLTRGVNLQGRTFLHSYQPDDDPEGAILEKIMTAPLIVGQMINLQYYFSAVDPWFWGSGSKVIHNVVSGVGVMLGSQSDLQTGLPLQTVNNGVAHYHEPMRLLALIEAPTARISSIIKRQALLQRLFHNGWLCLVAANPSTGEFDRYNPDGSWESVQMNGEGPVPA